MVIETGTALSLLEKLLNKIKVFSSEREDEKAKMAEELLIVPKDIESLYVEPTVQNSNPVNDISAKQRHRSSLFEFIRDFIEKPAPAGAGTRHIFLMGDAGMGKTTSLAMLKIMHLEKFIGKNYKCEVLKLGNATLDKIDAIQHKSKTVLLLDSLDEDPLSQDNEPNRLVQIMKATEAFCRVVITCRNQYLPINILENEESSDNFKEYVKLKGFKSRVYYLSPFSNEQVGLYLRKRFTDRLEYERAFQKVLKVKDIFVRPLLLSYIDDVNFDSGAETAYEIIGDVVDRWLEREAAKPNAPEKEAIFYASLAIARYLLRQNTRLITKPELLKIKSGVEGIAPVNLTGINKAIKSLTRVNLEARSLINRDSFDNFLFAHKIFQEYLVVKSLELNWGWGGGVATQVVLEFMASARLNQVNLKGFQAKSTESDGLVLASVDLTESNLSEVYFESLCFRESKLDKSSFNKLKFHYCEFVDDVTFFEAKINDSSLSSVKFIHSNIDGLDFKSTELTDCQLLSCRLKRTNFIAGPISESTFTRCILTGTEFHHVPIKDSVFIDCEMDGTQFRNCKIKGVTITGGKLNDVDFVGVDFDGCTFSGVDLGNTSFSEECYFANITLIDCKNLEAMALPTSLESKSIRREVKSSSRVVHITHNRVINSYSVL